ncbi:MAG: TolC family protein [Planctomycetes bacterium]|nr:TolC family protein [Planctomycetota bacterium]
MSNSRIQFATKPLWKKLISLTLIGAMLPGCSGPDKKLTYLGDPAPLDVQDHVMEIDHPDIDEPTPEAVTMSRKPRHIGDRNRDEIWDLSLSEAIHIALTNSKILRTAGEFGASSSPGSSASQVLNNANGVPGIFDPAIQDSGVLVGGRGVEAALAQFDPQFNLQTVWGSNNTIQNNTITSGGLVKGNVLNADTAQFSTGITKNFAYGANFQVVQSINYQYLGPNIPTQLFPSVYTGNLQMQYTQPMWAGSGAEYTRIAGPFNTQIQGVSGVNQGVLISRINTDLSIADFEMSVRNTLFDVEKTYWDLYLAYRTYDTNVEARNSYLRSWRFAHANKGVGKFSDLDELQSRQAFFQGRAAVEDSLQNLYSLELQLRRLLSLPSSDGRIIRPKDDPTTGEYLPDWNMCLAEALTRREELRKQKWNIKSNELQLKAAKSLIHPQLNFISTYQINGFGNNLFNIEGQPDNGPGGVDVQSFFATQGAANQRGFTAGFQFTMPLGFRQALSQVRNYELRVAKAKEVLANQELEVCHELSRTFQNLSWRYQQAQSNYNRWQVAEAQVPGRENRYRTGVPGIDTSVLLQQWLQTRTDAANAEVTFYQSVVEYQKSIADLHYRKGTLLEMNNVHLAESTWTPDAYQDAFRRAYARAYAIDALDADPVHAEPEPFERQGWIGGVELMGSGIPEQLPVPLDPNEIHSKSGPLSMPADVPKQEPVPVEQVPEPSP